MNLPIDIDAERSRSRAAGVQLEENLPFLLSPASGRSERGILLVHGLTASPYEMKPLAQHLAAQDSWVYALRLPGHGTTPEQLATTCQEEWQAEVNRGMRFLHANCRQCFGVGMSTGSLLLLASAAIIESCGLVLLSPFLRVRHRLAPFAGILQNFVSFQYRPLPTSQRPYYYERRPVAAVAQLNRLQRRIRPLLKQVQTPILMLNSVADQTIDPESAKEIYSRLGSRDKTHHSYPEPAPHVLISAENPYLEDTFARIDQFVASCSQSCR